MGLKVAKFGGSSVADAIQIQKTKDIIKADPDRRYIVVSAPGKRYPDDSKITDLLYLCKTHIDHNVPYDQVFQVVSDRYIAMEANLGVSADIVGKFQEIKDNLEKGASADYIASRGEHLNALLIAKYLGYDFVDTDELIKFDENGRFLSDETKEALSKELKKHERAVLPGFYGAYPNGEIKTFSRGGSDITGALVASAIKAEVYENWTDVSGFLMADPRIVDNPKAIDTISYKELRELSYMGASVLHESAIYPAMQEGIPINIKNTNRPEDKGTMIVEEPADLKDSIITGIAGSKDFLVFGIYKNMMTEQPGFIRRLLRVLEDYNIPVEHIPTGIDSVSIVIAKKHLDDNLGNLLEEFEQKVHPDNIEVYDNMAIIATVGAGMAARLGVSAQLFTALFEAGVNVRMIDQGSSEMNIIVGVKNRDFEKAIRAIYSSFVK